ncbi:MAG TPA: hypothetical protein VFL55_11760 [Acetobacteraceae bacterium]|nr:hypothetical protein [Acetobacteraceae bacterium]
MKSIFLHIGTHRTGTTSLQAYLGRRRTLLNASDFAFYRGGFMPNNHIELHAAALRAERDTPFRHYARIADIERLRRRTEQRIGAFLERVPQQNLIFSAEGLTYLRHDDEVAYLATLLSPAQTTVIVYLRNRTEFLRSYKRQMLLMHLPLSAEKDHYAYCEPDSWLVDYDALIAAYTRHYSDIRVLNYDEISARDRSIIPSFAKEIGWRDYDAAGTRLFLNVSRKPL